MLRLLAPAVAVLVLMPVTLAGLAAVALAAVAAAALDRPAWGALLRAQQALLLLLAWLALTAAWSPAPPADLVGHGWRYLALGFVLVIAQAVEPAAARRALDAFVAAAAALALLQLAGVGRLVPVDSALASAFHYTGNKAIANGALLALAAAWALHRGLQPGASWRQRGPAFAAAALAAAAVLWHGASRTGPLVLGGLGLVLLLAHLRDRRAWLAVALLALGAAAVWGSGGGGLGWRAATGQLEGSNSVRLAVYRETAQMVLERPLAGHGLGSWPTLWRERSADPALAGMNTAHQEWLSIAQQGGLPAALLLLAVVAVWARRALAGGLGPAGTVSVLALAAWALLSMVHAAFRDAAFAAPMAVLLALALAAQRDAQAAPGPGP